MKLRTEIKEIRLVADAFGLQDMANDAIAAHAMLQAMEVVLTRATREVVQERADELMRQWLGEKK